MRYELWSTDPNDPYNDTGLFVGNYATQDDAEAAAENLLGVDADWWVEWQPV